MEQLNYGMTTPRQAYSVGYAEGQQDVQREIAEFRAENERLRKVLISIEKMPCLADLLGEGNKSCGCAHCQARAALEQKP